MHTNSSLSCLTTRVYYESQEMIHFETWAKVDLLTEVYDIRML
jgi:hypothetical protein